MKGRRWKFPLSPIRIHRTAFSAPATPQVAGPTSAPTKVQGPDSEVQSLRSSPCSGTSGPLRQAKDGLCLDDGFHQYSDVDCEIPPVPSLANNLRVSREPDSPASGQHRDSTAAGKEPELLHLDGIIEAGEPPSSTSEGPTGTAGSGSGGTTISCARKPADSVSGSRHSRGQSDAEVQSQLAANRGSRESNKLAEESLARGRFKSQKNLVRLFSENFRRESGKEAPSPLDIPGTRSPLPQCAPPLPANPIQLTKIATEPPIGVASANLSPLPAPVADSCGPRASGEHGPQAAPRGTRMLVKAPTDPEQKSRGSSSEMGSTGQFMLGERRLVKTATEPPENRRSVTRPRRLSQLPSPLDGSSGVMRLFRVSTDNLPSLESEGSGGSIGEDQDRDKLSPLSPFTRRKLLFSDLKARRSDSFLVFMASAKAERREKKGLVVNSRESAPCPERMTQQVPHSASDLGAPNQRRPWGQTRTPHDSSLPGSPMAPPAALQVRIPGSRSKGHILRALMGGGRKGGAHAPMEMTCFQLATPLLRALDMWAQLEDRRVAALKKMMQGDDERYLEILGTFEEQWHQAGRDWWAQLLELWGRAYALGHRYRPQLATDIRREVLRLHTQSQKGVRSKLQSQPQSLPSQMQAQAQTQFEADERRGAQGHMEPLPLLPPREEKRLIDFLENHMQATCSFQLQAVILEKLRSQAAKEEGRGFLRRAQTQTQSQLALARRDLFLGQVTPAHIRNQEKKVASLRRQSLWYHTMESCLPLFLALLVLLWTRLEEITGRGPPDDLWHACVTAMSLGGNPKEESSAPEPGAPGARGAHREGRGELTASLEGQAEPIAKHPGAALPRSSSGRGECPSSRSVERWRSLSARVGARVMTPPRDWALRRNAAHHLSGPLPAEEEPEEPRPSQKQLVGTATSLSPRTGTPVLGTSAPHLRPKRHLKSLSLEEEAMRQLQGSSLGPRPALIIPLSSPGQAKATSREAGSPSRAGSAMALEDDVLISPPPHLASCLRLPQGRLAWARSVSSPDAQLALFPAKRGSLSLFRAASFLRKSSSESQGSGASIVLQQSSRENHSHEGQPRGGEEGNSRAGLGDGTCTAGRPLPGTVEEGAVGPRAADNPDVIASSQGAEHKGTAPSQAQAGQSNGESSVNLSVLAVEDSAGLEGVPAAPSSSALNHISPSPSFALPAHCPGALHDSCPVSFSADNVAAASSSSFTFKSDAALELGNAGSESSEAPGSGTTHSTGHSPARSGSDDMHKATSPGSRLALLPTPPLGSPVPASNSLATAALPAAQDSPTSPPSHVASSRSPAESRSAGAGCTRLPPLSPPIPLSLSSQNLTCLVEESIFSLGNPRVLQPPFSPRIEKKSPHSHGAGEHSPYSPKERLAPLCSEGSKSAHNLGMRPSPLSPPGPEHQCRSEHGVERAGWWGGSGEPSPRFSPTPFVLGQKLSRSSTIHNGAISELRHRAEQQQHQQQCSGAAAHGFAGRSQGELPAEGSGVLQDRLLVLSVEDAPSSRPLGASCALPLSKNKGPGPPRKGTTLGGCGMALQYARAVLILNRAHTNGTPPKEEDRLNIYRKLPASLRVTAKRKLQQRITGLEASVPAALATSQGQPEQNVQEGQGDPAQRRMQQTVGAAAPVEKQVLLQRPEGVRHPGVVPKQGRLQGEPGTPSEGTEEQGGCEAGEAEGDRAMAESLTWLVPHAQCTVTWHEEHAYGCSLSRRRRTVLVETFYYFRREPFERLLVDLIVFVSASLYAHQRGLQLPGGGLEGQWQTAGAVHQGGAKSSLSTSLGCTRQEDGEIPNGSNASSENVNSNHGLPPGTADISGKENSTLLV